MNCVIDMVEITVVASRTYWKLFPFPRQSPPWFSFFINLRHARSRSSLPRNPPRKLWNCPAQLINQNIINLNLINQNLISLLPPPPSSFASLLDVFLCSVSIPNTRYRWRRRLVWDRWWQGQARDRWWRGQARDRWRWVEMDASSRRLHLLTTTTVTKNKKSE